MVVGVRPSRERRMEIVSAVVYPGGGSDVVVEGAREGDLGGSGVLNAIVSWRNSSPG